MREDPCNSVWGTNLDNSLKILKKGRADQAQ